MAPSRSILAINLFLERFIMIYVIAPGGVYANTVNDNQGNIAWDANHYCTPSALTSDEKAQFGVFLLILVPVPTYSQLTQAVAEVTPLPINGVWTQQYQVSSLDAPSQGANLASAISSLQNQLENQRLSIQSAGLPYTFPDATTGTIQTRDPNKYPDLLNINAYATMGMLALTAGTPAMPIGFIDSANVSHAMTPAQAVALATAVSTFIGTTYTKKQAIRATIAALTLQTIGSFDITQGWN